MSKRISTVAIVKSLRPLQWLKNLVMFAPLIFSGLLFSEQTNGVPYLMTVFYSFVIFCVLASSVYLFNDVIDYEADRAHPFKRKRPIASGEVPIPVAIGMGIAGLIIVAILSIPLNLSFKVLIAGYLILQVLYSKKLKQFPIWDIGAIATSFVIRVYAGATVAYIHLNSWFLLTVISAALFLAVGKRQSERTLMLGSQPEKLGTTRGTLKRYSQRLLDQYTSIFATATWLAYALFTFQYQFVQSENLAQFYDNLPIALRPEKLLMFTIPLAIIGIMRYLQLVYESNQGESPERVLIKDKPLLLLALTLITMVIVLIYGPTTFASFL